MRKGGILVEKESGKMIEEEVKSRKVEEARGRILELVGVLGEAGVDLSDDEVRWLAKRVAILRGLIKRYERELAEMVGERVADGLARKSEKKFCNSDKVVIK